MRLVVSAVIGGLLALAGLSVDAALEPSTLVVPGTEVSRTDALMAREFGASSPVPILVKGPPRALERDGRALVRALRSDARVDVLSPWDLPEGDRSLQPSPEAAVVVAQVQTSRDDSGWVMPHVRGSIARTVDAPVRAYPTGKIPIGTSLEEESLKAAVRAERIAVPLLVLVLLLVLRAPIAALLPLMLGGLAVAASRGVIRLAAELVSLDVAAVTAASMLGLALGVDYAMLIVARFREERGAGQDVAPAARIARATAGRTVIFASCTLVAAMAVALVLSPGALLRSLAAGTITASVVCATLAWLAIPATLRLLGDRVDSWRFPWGNAKTRGRKRAPALVAPLVLVALLALALPGLALRAGPIDARQLPAESQARIDFEQVARTLGPGWAGSFEIVAVSRKGVITDADRLRRLAAWQKRTARLPGVLHVIGPGGVMTARRAISRVPSDLHRLRRQLSGAGRHTEELANGLQRAGRSVGELREGLRTAGSSARTVASGSRRLVAGTDQLAAGTQAAKIGAGRLARGAQRASSGNTRLRDGLRAAGSGIDDLRDGTRKLQRGIRGDARAGAVQLTVGLDAGSRDLRRLREPVQLADRRLADAFGDLQAMSVGKTDPKYAAVLRAVGEARAAVTGRDPRDGSPVRADYDGLNAALGSAADGLDHAVGGATALTTGLGRLATGAGRLGAGLGRLDTGLGRLSSGAARQAGGQQDLAEGTRRLAKGLDRLGTGAGRLQDGTRRLRDGSRTLADGLTSGPRRAAPLQDGLADASSRVRRDGRRLRRAATHIGGQDTRLFKSSYAVLAALDSSTSPAQRRLLTQAISLERGGRAARLLVIPATGPTDPRTAQLLERLGRSTDRLAQQAGLVTGITGAGAELATFEKALAKRFPFLVLALALMTWLVLVVLLRSVWVPLIAVALNLVTVGATFGLLTLLVGLDARPLGDTGFLDAVTAVAIFTVTFGLSIDYEVFLLTRMREGWLRTGDAEQALQFALSRTASVVTGAALIMTGVFAAFASSGVANVRQLGVGLAIAVLLDATVVRLFLLPAALRALGRRAWHLPAALDRYLPDVPLH